MKHIQWITEQMNKGKTWDELKNLTEKSSRMEEDC